MKSYLLVDSLFFLLWIALAPSANAASSGRAHLPTPSERKDTNGKLRSKQLGKVKVWWETQKHKVRTHLTKAKHWAIQLLESGKLTTSLTLLLLSIIFFIVGSLTILDSILFLLGTLSLIGALFFFILWLIEKARSAPAAPTN